MSELKAAGRLWAITFVGVVAVASATVLAIELLSRARGQVADAELRARSFLADMRAYAARERAIASDANHLIFEAYVATLEASKEWGEQ